MLFNFCTVILCCLDSRENKNQEGNCRPSLRPTVQKGKPMHPTAEQVGIIRKNEEGTAGQAPDRQFKRENICLVLSTKQPKFQKASKKLPVNKRPPLRDKVSGKGSLSIDSLLL